MLRALVEKTIKAAIKCWEFGGKEERTKEKVITLPLNNPLVQLDCCMQGGIMELEKMQKRQGQTSGVQHRTSE